MARRVLLLFLILGLLLALSNIAIAQDDDDDTVDDDDDTTDDDDDTTDDDDDTTDDDDDTTDDDDDTTDDDDDTGDDDDDFFASTLVFDSPTALDPETEYEFQFTVTNNAIADDEEKAEWIKAVDLTLPSQEYLLDETDLTAPEPLYPEETERWEVEFDANSSTISWQCFGVVTSVNYGDIREGDFLSFQFIATTDSVPTGTYESEVGFNWVLYGDNENVVPGTSYIGEEPVDDDDDTLGDDDDDSGGGGCGC